MLALQGGDRAIGCGPFFPPSALDGGDKALLAAPVADFAHEIDRLLPKVPVRKSYWAFAELPDAAAQTDAADVAEVLAVTADSALAQGLAGWRKKLRVISTKEHPAPPPGNPPAGLPLEFLLYENGALLYHQGDLAGARAQWQRLLDLPEKSRQHRTLWAAYMIGRSYVDADPEKAATLLAKVGSLVKPAGLYDDPLGFAQAAIGWQAKALWKHNEKLAAMHLYMKQAGAGDPGAVWSLRDCAVSLLASDKPTLKQMAEDPVARQVLTAYLISNGGLCTQSTAAQRDKSAHAWLQTLETLSLKNVAGADRLAWAAYKANEMKLAQRWLNLAEESGEGTPAAQWIQAKLLLRNGNVEKAAACLAKAAKAFPVDENWNNSIQEGEDDWRPAAHVAGELAALKLGRGNYTESLDLLFRQGWWWDAAYVAERVLTVDELKAYVDKNWPAGSKIVWTTNHRPVSRYGISDVDGEVMTGAPPDPAELRHLLARRLARLGRLKEARGYFDAEMQKIFDGYVAGLREGRDKGRSAVERGRALFAAARIARHDGLEILGTECGPDEARTGGNFQLDPMNETRGGLQKEGEEHFAPNLPHELKRAAAVNPAPNVRWHYRYIAANLAWEASLQLPDDTVELRDLLEEAAGWIKARDPKAAARFFKAEYKRCSEATLSAAKTQRQ